MSKYLDPTNDVAFKKVFGDKARLQKLLNSIMRFSAEMEIVDLEYIPTEQVPDLGQLKRSIVDIKCTDRQGNSYIVEMQNGYADEFLKRVQLYGSSAVTGQVKRGRTYADIAPVVLVLILNGYKPLIDEDLDVITFHRTVEVNTGRNYLKDLSYVFVELDRFNKEESQLKTFEDQWLYFLSKCDKTQNPPKNLYDKDILSAYEAINQFNWTSEELDRYNHAKLASDTEVLNLKHEFNKGKAEGKAEGIQIGEVKLKEEKEKIVKASLKKGLDVKTISEIAGLAKEEIEKIKKEM